MRSLALVLVTPLACAPAPPSPAHDGARGASLPAVSTVEVVAVARRPLATTTHLQGELAPYESVSVYARANGFVASVAVDRGAAVREGQLLARLVAPEMAAQRAEVEARLQGEQSTLERLRAAARTEGAVTAHEVDLAEAAVHGDCARVRALRDVEGYLTVRAPFAAVVTERNVHPGALVGPAMGAATPPMFKLEQIARLRLNVAVPEQLAGEVAEGAAARFTVRAWPLMPFEGVIQRLSRTVDRRTRTMTIELDVDNAAGRLAPGMYADVVWPVRREAPTAFVPPSAVVQTTERTFVVRVRDGVVEQVLAQRGMTVGDQVEVFGELAQGDLVARRGSDELLPGTHVHTRMYVPDAGAAH